MTNIALAAARFGRHDDDVASVQLETQQSTLAQPENANTEREKRQSKSGGLAVRQYSASGVEWSGVVDSTMIGSGSVCFVGPPIKKTAVQPMLTCMCAVRTHVPYPCAVRPPIVKPKVSPEQRDAHADDAAPLVLFDVIQVARQRQVVAVRVQRVVVHNARLPCH